MMIDFARIAGHALQSQPFACARIDELYAPADAQALARTFLCDRYKKVAGYGGEKDYEYDARPLITMGGDLAHFDGLSEAWQALARDLHARAYRDALSALTGIDLASVPLEVNVFHYGPRACLGPHRDLPEKLVTHVLYFNEAWDRADGGCLSVLRSADPDDAAAEILPIVGNSFVIVRSEKSWHAVSRVRDACQRSRRSLTATFYAPGAISTMWPPGDTTPLRRYDPAALELEAAG
jgi:SM-20-related protein